MYHWSPTSLSFCIIMTVVTYSTFSRTGRMNGDGDFGGWWWWWGGGLGGWVGGMGGVEAEERMNGGQVRKGGDTQVA